MIRVAGLSFSHRDADGNALEDISFRLEPGDLVCLVGMNGSGKSTLLGLLAGVYSPNSGSVDLGNIAGGKVRIGLVPQNPDTYILGSLVEEDLLLALDPADRTARERALSLAARFGLDGKLREAVHTLSYGQKKKLSLASALAAEPDVLLLDEPFAGLDYPAALAMREALAENKKLGLTQLVCEHDLDLLADLADSFILLNAGRLVALGPGDDVFHLLAPNGVRPPCWHFNGCSSPLWQKA